MDEAESTHMGTLDTTDSVRGTYGDPNKGMNHMPETTNAHSNSPPKQTLRPILPKLFEVQGQIWPAPVASRMNINSILNNACTSPQQSGRSNTPRAFTHQPLGARTNIIPDLDAAVSVNPKPTCQLDRWHEAREYRRMVHAPPYIDPRTDRTITQIEKNSEFWVHQLILAMLNTSSVKDRDSSHARRVFLPGAYDPLLIESACREIFLSLLDRCRNGFRGPPTFNKALKPGRDLDADRSATCQERLQNIVGVLRWNKRVCKDVLYEDWKIRLLVNHPLAYDKEKDSQKESNDQRRARLVEEREKLRMTEEELREYQQMTDAQADGMQFHNLQWSGEKRVRVEDFMECEGIDPKKLRLEE